MRKSTQLSLYAGLVVTCCVALYWWGLDGPLLFDDRPALTANDLVQIDGNTFDEWRVAAFSSNSGPLRRPLAMLTFAANHALAGDFSEFSLKAINLVIHIAIGVLLYSLFLAILDALGIGPNEDTRRFLALTAVAIWLIHPLNVSTVLYAVQRMAQLASLFVLAGLLVFMRYRQRWARKGASSGEVIAAALWLLLLTVLAILSKENGALLPWLVVVLEVCVFRSVWAGRPNRYLLWVGWSALLIPLLLVISAVLLSPETITAGYTGREFTLEQRFLTQGRLLWRYLGWLCVPNINDMGFQHDDIRLSTGLLAPVTTALAFAAWLLVLVVAFLLRRRYPLFLLALLFFLVGHSMESTVLPLEMVYEHRNYLPGTLVCLVLASMLVLPFVQSRRIGVWYPILGVLAILCMLLFVRVQTWSDELTLSRINLLQHPESSRSNYFYANAMLRHYRRAGQGGVSDAERIESLLLSRHYFERMYQTNDRDIAALVMLIYLDGQFFTELQDQVDWLAKLERLLETRVLQASDWNALATLFDLFSAEGNTVPAARITALLDTLSARYPNSVEVLRYRYQYLSSRKEKSEDLLPILRQAQRLAPATAWVYYYQIYENSRVHDVAGMYEGARQWLLADRQRYSLRQLKELFSETEIPQEDSHD